MSSGEVSPDGISNLRSSIALSAALVLSGGVSYGVANSLAAAVDYLQQDNISECTFALEQVKPGQADQVPRECSSFNRAMLQKSVTVYSNVYTGTNKGDDKKSFTRNTYLLPSAGDFVQQEEQSWQKTKNDWKHLDEGIAVIGCVVGLAALVLINPDLTKFKKRKPES